MKYASQKKRAEVNDARKKYRKKKYIGQRNVTEESVMLVERYGKEKA